MHFIKTCFSSIYETNKRNKSWQTAEELRDLRVGWRRRMNLSKLHINNTLMTDTLMPFAVRSLLTRRCHYAPIVTGADCRRKKLSALFANQLGARMYENVHISLTKL